MLTNRSIHTILYGMESSREVSWFKGTTESQIFFNDTGSCHIFEPSLGFLAARSKHFLFEFTNEGNVSKDLRTD